MGKFYIYLHVSNCGNIYYAGKGTGPRAFISNGRSDKWASIKKSSGMKVYVSSFFENEIESYMAERRVIATLKKLGFKLTNKTLGGDGSRLEKITKETRKKQRAAKIGKKQSKDHAMKSAISRLGQKNTPWHIERTAASKRKPVINSDGEIFVSATSAAIEISKRLGFYPSQGNISMACRGERTEAYGYSWSYDISTKPPPPPKIKTGMKPVKCSNGMVFKSTMEAKRWVESWRGVANSQKISSCARGESLTAYGYSWEYISPDLLPEVA